MYIQSKAGNKMEYLEHEWRDLIVKNIQIEKAIADMEAACER